MCGATDAEKQGAKSSKLALANTKEGIATLKGVEQKFNENPLLKTIQGNEQAYQSNPFTYTPEFKDATANAASNAALKASEGSLGQFGAQADRLGIGRSQAGGGGLANLAALMGVGGVINANQQVERMAAQQRIADLNNAVNQGFNFLTQSYAPTKEVGLAQLGTLGGLSSLTGANAQLAGQQSGPLDFLGGPLGAGLGAFTGGLGLGGAQSFFK